MKPATAVLLLALGLLGGAWAQSSADCARSVPNCSTCEYAIRMLCTVPRAAQPCHCRGQLVQLGTSRSQIVRGPTAPAAQLPASAPHHQARPTSPPPTSPPYLGPQAATSSTKAP